MVGPQARNRKHASLFHYGFLSSRTSQALNEYLETGQISQESKNTLNDAYGLLKDILLAQDLFSFEKESVVPSEQALDAFKCALDLIVERKEEFNIRKLSELIGLFKSIHSTLKKLSNFNNGLEAPSPENIEKTRMFFKGLSKMILSQLSVSKQQTPVPRLY